MTPMTPNGQLEINSQALDRLAAIARAAGAAAMVHYDHPAVELKGDRSPVTAADRAAHAVVGDRLAAWVPAIPVISEEGRIPAFAERREWSRFWLVDPLDGTKEFIQRNGEFTVNIALVDDGEPVLGVVFAPAVDLLYVAGRGLGAWRQRGAAPRERIVSRTAPRPGGLIVVESRSHPSAELERFMQTLHVAERIAAGSSLKFCLVADGTADLYPRFGPTMEWDVAAGDCIWRNAAESQQNPSPLRYNTAELRNEGFVIGATTTQEAPADMASETE
jgi:3'(2'), 5'-bisphosphate nucleotidase